ncbi:MAG: lytic murein transglycosylase [Gammaproteobacteria bacterium]|nr:lytic murein transglycosylase [Gammaproteobacteria bacterium]
MPFTRNILILVTIFTVFSNASIAGTSNSNHVTFDNWVERVKKQAQDQGISPSTLDSAFSNLKQVQIGTSGNKTLSGEQFPNYSLADNRVNNHKRMITHYSNVLFEIKHLFGVNPEVIVALWGTDNTYNQNKKQYPVIDVLTSMSYKQPANSSLKNELFQALKIIDEGRVSTLQMKSDFNGNLGSTPFKPTTFRNYAIDYDGDGKFDIWQNHADIFASTANYLNNIGWKTGEPWGIEIKLPPNFESTQIGLNQQRKISRWQDLGIRMPNGSDLPQMTSSMGSIIQPGTHLSKSYLVFDNYFALLRWKRSQQFAFAVGMMADKIKQPAGTTPMAPFADVSQ